MEFHVNSVPPTHLWAMLKKQGDVTVSMGGYSAKRTLLIDTIARK